MNDFEYEDFLRDMEAVGTAQGLPRLTQFALSELDRLAKRRENFQNLLAGMTREAEDTWGYEVSAEEYRKALEEVRKRKEEE